MARLWPSVLGGMLFAVIDAGQLQLAITSALAHVPREVMISLPYLGALSAMYTTFSPCHMCTGAILLYGIPRVVLGENRTFMGAEDLLRANGVEVVNLDSAECVNLMTDFIAAHPTLWNEDIGVED